MKRTKEEQQVLLADAMRFLPDDVARWFVEQGFSVGGTVRPGEYPSFAFAGYKRSGKSLAGECLEALGWQMISLGDIIKEYMLGIYCAMHLWPNNATFIQAVLARKTFLEWCEDVSGQVELSPEIVLDKSYLTLPNAMESIRDADSYVLTELTAETTDFFTEDDSIKDRIRPLLEWGGEWRYDLFINALEKKLNAGAGPFVNPRIVKKAEADIWSLHSGAIVVVDRGPEYSATSPWEFENLEVLKESGFVTGTILNGQTEAHLWACVICQLYHISTHESWTDIKVMKAKK
jgi:hypothetical protein